MKEEKATGGKGRAKESITEGGEKVKYDEIYDEIYVELGIETKDLIKQRDEALVTEECTIQLFCRLA